MHYTGVGTRKIHDTAHNRLNGIARELFLKGLVLRSGGAIGADTAFARGSVYHLPTQVVVTNHALLSEIYIPWDGYNGLVLKDRWEEKVLPLTHLPDDLVAKATEMAARIHPKWSRCTDGARKLHTRNVFQVLGMNLDDPSAFFVCWADYEDRKCTPMGGTRTAWMIAQEYGLPCFNLKNRKHTDEYERFVNFFL